MARKVLRVVGDQRSGIAQDLVILLGRQTRHQGRLVLGTLGFTSRRMRPYETAINGFRCNGIGDSFVINPNRTTGGWRAINAVEYIIYGNMNESGLITWDHSTEMREV